MSLRPYQQDAVNTAVEWCKTTTSPAVLELATGAGKSHIIAAIADWIYTASGQKMVLCLAPSAELVTQNREKFTDRTGRPTGLLSASAGKRNLSHPVIFGSERTVVNQLDKLSGRVCAVIIDECHGVTPTIKRIISELREGNEFLRVIGLSATPYRLGGGYIYQTDADGTAYGPDQARDPYFAKRIFTADAGFLIAQGFLTPPVVGSHAMESYDTSGLTMNRLGQFDSTSVDRAFLGKGRLTAEIVADVVLQSRDRKGVIFFASTVAHSKEIMESLPPGLSALITGETPKKERKDIIRDFKAQQIKYLVNVSVLTTGFDAPHVDVVALLRATESVSLMQQMIGRGLRLAEGKEDCLVLDYAGNVERHCPDGDLFNPEIKADGEGGAGKQIEARCPDCKAINSFTVLPDVAKEKLKIDENGYVVDLLNRRIKTEYGDQPAHYGRRCNGQVKAIGDHEYRRCEYRWTFKPCPECEEENDIAARRCSACKSEMVNPNEKLSLDYARRKKDPTMVHCEVVESWKPIHYTSQNGNDCVRVEVVTTDRAFTLYFMVNSEYSNARRAHDRIKTLTKDWTETPRTVIYKQNPKTEFFEFLGMNQPPDKAPDEVPSMA